MADSPTRVRGGISEACSWSCHDARHVGIGDRWPGVHGGVVLERLDDPFDDVDDGLLGVGVGVRESGVGAQSGPHARQLIVRNGERDGCDEGFSYPIASMSRDAGCKPLAITSTSPADAARRSLKVFETLDAATKLNEIDLVLVALATTSTTSAST